MSEKSVSEATLRGYMKEIEWIDSWETAPFSQAMAIHEILQHYKINFVRVGYSHSGILAIETKHQVILHKDMGGVAEFKGILDKIVGKNGKVTYKKNEG